MNKIEFKYMGERLITPSRLSLVGRLLGGVRTIDRHCQYLSRRDKPWHCH